VLAAEGHRAVLMSAIRATTAPKPAVP